MSQIKKSSLSHYSKRPFLDLQSSSDLVQQTSTSVLQDVKIGTTRESEVKLEDEMLQLFMYTIDDVLVKAFVNKLAKEKHTRIGNEACFYGVQKVIVLILPCMLKCFVMF